MSLKERVYSVLLVSSAETFNTSMQALLPESKYSPVCITSSISAARRSLLERSFDFVLINSPLAEDTGTRFAIDAAGGKGSVVLLLVKNEIHDEIYDKVAEHGVFTLPKPTSKPIILLAMSWLASAREKLRKLEKKTLTVEEKMEEIRLVNRAKWLLIEHLKMTEPDSHHYIEKQAMDRCISKREMAEAIIKTYS